MREHAENPAGTGTALTAMLFSGGRARWLTGGSRAFPAPRWSTAPDSNLVAAGSLADARTACGRQARTVRTMWACGACGSATGTCRVPADPVRSWTTERTFCTNFARHIRRRVSQLDVLPGPGHLEVIRAAAARGVTIRRVRVVSEPLSDYLRWEHACTTVNIEAGEDIRWLPRTKAADLMLPGADCFVFDHRVVRWNFQRGDGTNPRHYTFSSDPRTIRDIVAAFELAWNRATPHAEYKTH